MAADRAPGVDRGKIYRLVIDQDGRSQVGISYPWGLHTGVGAEGHRRAISRDLTAQMKMAWQALSAKIGTSSKGKKPHAQGLQAHYQSKSHSRKLGRSQKLDQPSG